MANELSQKILAIIDSNLWLLSVYHVYSFQYACLSVANPASCVFRTELNIAFSRDAPTIVAFRESVSSATLLHQLNMAIALIYVIRLNQANKNAPLTPSLPFFCVVLPDPQPALHRQQDPEKRPQPRDE